MDHKDVNSSKSVAKNYNPSPWETLKINSDAAMRGNGSFLDIMVKDEAGDLVDAHSFKVNTQDPMIVELLAVWQALTVSVQYGWKNICYDIDSKTPVQSLNDGNFNGLHWSTESITNDTARLCRFFDKVSFLWCYRNCNRLTHVATKWATENDFGSLIREEFYPQAVFDYMTHDKKAISST